MSGGVVAPRKSGSKTPRRCGCVQVLRAHSNQCAHLPQRVSERRCKIPARRIFASPNSLTLGIPLAILGGSCR